VRSQKFSRRAIIAIIFYPQEVKIPGVKKESENKLAWLHVGVVLNWKSRERGMN